MAIEKNGWLFPEGVAPPADHHWHRFQIADKTIHGFDWQGHLELAREYGDEGIERLDSECVASGTTEAGLYAAVRVTIVVNGDSFSAVHGAEWASDQVRDPDMVWAVAESRATKRVVKKALGLRPADSDTSEASDSTVGDGVPDQAPDDVDSMPSEWEDTSVGSEEIDW